MWLRTLTRADGPFVWTALYHALHVPPGADPFPPEAVRQPDVARYASGWMDRPGDLGVLAERVGERVGAAWLRLWPPGDRGFGFVDGATPELSMSVLPPHRGRGVGTALLGRLLAEAAGEFGSVSLSVSRTNPARRLYRRFGFTAVGEPSGGSVVMARRLAVSPGGTARAGTARAGTASGTADQPAGGRA